MIKLYDHGEVLHSPWRSCCQWWEVLITTTMLLSREFCDICARRFVRCLGARGLPSLWGPLPLGAPSSCLRRFPLSRTLGPINNIHWFPLGPNLQLALCCQAFRQQSSRFMHVAPSPGSQMSQYRPIPILARTIFHCGHHGYWQYCIQILSLYICCIILFKTVGLLKILISNTLVYF